MSVFVQVQVYSGSRLSDCLSAQRQLAALRELPVVEGSRSVRISVMDPGVRADIEAFFPFYLTT